MGQLFYNLIGNSLKFVKGSPIINVTCDYEEKITANQSGAARYHRISVIDNGIGIEEKYIAKIFTIFKRLHHQSEYDGTGIGLALCDKIVENHEGMIEINSTPGTGTRVDVYLPIS